MNSNLKDLQRSNNTCQEILSREWASVRVSLQVVMSKSFDEVGALHDDTS